MIALNRAVAVAKVHGPARGIAQVETILNQSPLDSYYLTHAVMGDLERERNHVDAAATHFEEALNLTEVESERAFLARRLQECRTG